VSSYPHYASVQYPLPSGFGQAATPDPLNIERPYTLARFLAECLLIWSVGARVFGEQLGFYQIQGLVGVNTLVCTIVCLLLMMSARERIPTGIWFLVAINASAALSNFIFHQVVPFFGGETAYRALFFPLLHLIMIYGVVQNKGAYRRFLVFLTILLMTGTFLGGVVTAGRVHKERLRLEGFHGAITNPNDLAYTAAFLSVALLFWSLGSSRTLKPLIWLLTGATFIVLLRTLSRGALAAFTGSVFIFLICVAGGRGLRLKGVVVIGLVVLSVAMGGHMIAQQVTDVQARMQVHSVRVDNFIHVWEDLPPTIISGYGPAINTCVVSATKVMPHNTFFWLHLGYGGPTAWIALVWLFVLLARARRMLFSEEVPFNLRMELVAVWLVAFVNCMMSNNGFFSFGAILPLALADKYLTPFSKKAIRARQTSKSVLRHGARRVYTLPQMEYGSLTTRGG